MPTPPGNLGLSETRNSNWQTGTTPPMFNAPLAVLGLIGGLVAVHVALQFGGDSWQAYIEQVFALIPARFTKPGFPMPAGSQYWSLVSYGFLHADWMHLLFNSLWLLVFGTPVARYLGSARFLLLSLISTVSGGLASLAVHWGEVVFVLGASAAVSGLLAAAIPIMYGQRVPGGWRPLGPGELMRSRKALLFMGIWLVVTLASGAAGWTGNTFMAEGGVAWEAHLGGFVGGLLAFYWLARRTVQLH